MNTLRIEELREFVKKAWKRQTLEERAEALTTLDLLLDVVDAARDYYEADDLAPDWGARQKRFECALAALDGVASTGVDAEERG
jgi:hypothetical protein